MFLFWTNITTPSILAECSMLIYSGTVIVIAIPIFAIVEAFLTKRYCCPAMEWKRDKEGHIEVTTYWKNRKEERRRNFCFPSFPSKLPTNIPTKLPSKLPTKRSTPSPPSTTSTPNLNSVEIVR